MEGPSNSLVSMRDQLQQKFDYLLVHQPEEVIEFCTQAKLSLDELHAQPLSRFERKGVPSGVSEVRHLHFEEQRLSKLLMVVSNLDQLETPTMITTVPIIEPPSKGSKRLRGHHYTTPDDFISHSLSKEREKHQRSLRTLNRIGEVQNRHEALVALRIKKLREKDSKVKANRELQRQKHLQAVSCSNEKRQKVLDNKKEIDRSFQEHCKESEKKLLMKMNRGKELSTTKVLESAAKKIKRDETNLDLSIQSIEEKISSKNQLHTQFLHKRVKTAGDHCRDVEKRWQSNQRQQNISRDESLKRSVQFSAMSEAKNKNKRRRVQSYAEKMKEGLSQSFRRQSRNMKDIENQRRNHVKKLQDKETKHALFFATFQQEMNNQISKKKLQNLSKKNCQVKKYEHILQSNLDYKMKILERHRKVNAVADGLKKFRETISQQKKQSNFDVQRLRTTQTAHRNNNLIYYI